MGVCGHAMTKSPEYGKRTLPACVCQAAYDWLLVRRFHLIYTEDDLGADSSHWEIPTDGLRETIRALRRGNTQFGRRAAELAKADPKTMENMLADVLEEGLDAMEKEGTNAVSVDWW